MVNRISVLHITTVLIIFFLWTGILIPKSHSSFVSLLSQNNINQIDCTVCSNPIKKGEKNYQVLVKLITVYEEKSPDKIAAYSSKGYTTALIPGKFVESYMPDKLYSSSGVKNAIICEEGFDLKLKGYFQNGQFYCTQAQNIQISNGILSKIKKFRGVLRIYFRRYCYSWGKAGGLFLALLSGIREYTDPVLSDNFKNAGLSHILALSGMHLSLFNNLAKKIFSIFKKKTIILLGQISFILFFVWFAGISPSLYRALLFSLTGLFILMLKNKSISMTKVFCISFIIHCITRPWDTAELSFKLSYGAIGGILVLSQGVQNIMQKILPEYTASSLSSSFASQTFTLPVCVKQLGLLTPIGLFSTIFVSPLITMFIYTGIIFFILGIIVPPLGAAGAFLMKILYTVIEKSVHIFSLFPSITL